jgi:16S rRNA processing protein RimM
VHTQDAVKLPAGRFYWHQVIGLRVDDQTGRTLGVVRDILETGANDVYVVQGDWGEILIPAVPDVVKDISPESGRIRVAVLPGMVPDAPPAERSRRPRRPSIQSSTSTDD